MIESDTTDPAASETSPLTRVYLTGFMASGKSTVGPRLARRLGYRFLDLDDAVEQRAGRTIPRLFAEEGETAFRVHEAAALRATGEDEEVVVALGGGALVDAANRAWALAHGTVVFLDVPPEVLARRLQTSRRDRPLLRDQEGRPLGEHDLAARVRTLLGARRACYTEAHLTVEAGGSADAVAETIARCLSR